MDQMPNSDEPKHTEQEQLAALISDIDRRLRTLEERYVNLRKKIQLTDENLIESERNYNKEMREFNDQILTIKRSLNDFGDKVVMFNSEITDAAKKSDLKTIEKYLAMWDPKIFVTRSELKEYLKSKGIYSDVEKDSS